VPALTSEAVLKNPLKLFGDYKVSEKDLLYYKKLIDQGDDEQAVDEFLAKYVDPYVEDYQQTLQVYIKQSSQGQLPEADKSGMERSIALLTVGITALLLQNFNDFSSRVISPPVFDQNKIVTKKLKDAILAETISQFEELTRNTMLETQTNVLSYIRTLQKEMIIENQKIVSLGLKEDALASEIAKFKANLRTKFPNLYKAMENGQILKSSIQKNGQVRNFQLSSFVKESVRTTLLNIERTAVEVDADLSGDQVVEYRQLDTRTVKQPREICIHILGNKINGKSLLALNNETANRLGIMTLATAKSEGAMGPHCRHGVLRVSEGFMKFISKQKEA